MRHESEFEDKELTCVERGVAAHTFTWTARDQAFYAEKEFTPPRRCREHAQARRAYFDAHPEKGQGDGKSAGYKRHERHDRHED